VRKLDLEAEVRGDVSVIHIEGYLNSLLGETIEEAVQERIKGGELKFIMDFSGTRMINSVGISIVIGIVKSVVDSGGVLAFTNLTTVQRELFEITGVSRLVRIFETKEDALVSMSAVA
jgi:anti-anti-sigma factor